MSVIKDLSLIYSKDSIEFQEKRYEDLKVRFKEIYGVNPSFISRFKKVNNNIN
jgi:hypothetical protein